MLIVMVVYSNNKQNRKMSSLCRTTKQKYPLLTDDYQERDQIVERRCQEGVGKHKHKHKHQSIKKKKRSSCIDGIYGKEQLEDVLKRQKQKEKQHLQVWKRQRNTKKRESKILISQSRQVKDTQKMESVKVFDEYEEHNGTFVWKHEGCNAECLNQDCLDWILDNINYY